MAFVITLRTRDSESDAALGAIPIPFADGAMTLGEMQTWVDGAIPIVEAAIGGYVEAADVTISLDNDESAGGPAPAGVYNERGAVFLMETSGPRRESIRLPQILHTKMTGTDVSLADQQITDFLNMFIVGINVNGLKVPKTPFGYNWVSGVRGKRSFRK